MEKPKKEFKCSNCGKLLFRYEIKDGSAEIKCKCGTTNLLNNTIVPVENEGTVMTIRRIES